MDRNPADKTRFWGLWCAGGSSFTWSKFPLQYVLSLGTLSAAAYLMADPELSLQSNLMISVIIGAEVLTYVGWPLQHACGHLRLGRRHLAAALLALLYLLGLCSIVNRNQMAGRQNAL
jgi:hypothetical protein